MTIIISCDIQSTKNYPGKTKKGFISPCWKHSIVIKPVWSWHKERHINPWECIQSPKIYPDNKLTKYLSRHFFKEDIQISNMNMFSTLVTKMYIKIAMKNLSTFIRATKIKISDYDNSWKGYGNIEALLHCWWAYNMKAPHWKIVC